MNLMKKRWILLIVACTINLCAGSIYAWSVFAPPLAERLSILTGEALTAGSLAAAFSLANAVGPIPMILGGAVNDRFGPRWVIASGGLLIGLVYGSTINTTLKFFPDHRGLAGGLTTALYGLSSVILPPVALALISAEGIQYALMTLGSVFAVVIVSGGLFMQKCPERFEEKFRSRAAAPVKPAREEVSWRGMLRAKRFPPMVLLLLCGAIPGMMIISHCWSAARELAGLDAAAASGAVSILALANVFGRILAGAASDRFGRLSSLMGALVLTLLGCALLSASDGVTALWFWSGILLVGIAFGAFMGIYPGFTAEEFGARSNSVNYGIMFCGFSIAGFAGPVAMNFLLKTGFSYQEVCLMASSLSLAGLLCGWIFTKSLPRKE